jgi:uncharacterized protein YndB with AHSA1/START domain
MKKIELEFVLRSSVKVLYTMISTASGLSRWFADDVNIDRDGNYIFIWDDSEETAKMLGKKRDEYVRFKWVEDEEDENYLELKINVDPMTNQVALIITDFCDEDDVEGASDLWEKQVDNLRQSIGS